MANKIKQLHNPKAPASKRQLWFLHVLTHEDTRDWKLTMLEAQVKITKFKANPPKRKATPTPAPVRKVAKKTILEPSTNGKRTEKRAHVGGGKITPLGKVERPLVEEA